MMASYIIQFVMICVGALCPVIRYFVSGEHARERHTRALLSNPNLPEEVKVSLLVDALLDSPFAIQ